MQTIETTEVINEQVEIAGEDVQVVGGGKSWRFAHGKIVRGKEKDGQSGIFEEEREKIVGRLDRVGIFVGNENGDTWMQVEADIETRDGMVHVKARLDDPDNPGKLKPSVSTVKFAWGLTQFKKNEQCMITASRSKERVKLKNGREGGYVTYVNFARLEKKIVQEGGKDVVKWIANPVYSPKRSANAPQQSLEDQWRELEPQILAHDAYKEREASSDERGPTHLSELSKEAAAKGWPTPEQAPNAWLLGMSKLFPNDGGPKATLRDHDDDRWGIARETLQPVKDMPSWLKEAAPAGNVNAGAFTS